MSQKPFSFRVSRVARHPSKQKKLAAMSEKTQSRIVHIRTTLCSDEQVASFVLSEENWPDAQIVSAFHAEPDKPNHYHLIVRFPSVVRWGKLRDWLEHPKRDPRAYCSTARSWLRSVRYLLHLDNPEKTKIPFENLRSWNIDDSELSSLLGSRKSPILADLKDCDGKTPFEAFEYLVCERGHLPSAVSSAIRCLIDLERYATCSKLLKPSKKVFPESDLDSLFSGCEFSPDLSGENHFFTASDFGGLNDCL